MALYATLASRDVDCCLIPESPFYLKGSGGLFEYMEKRLEENGHMVIVIAEGAGQDLISEYMRNNDEKDASGNKLHQDVGLCISQKIKLGVFEMSETGMQAVLNPSQMFLSEVHSDSEHLVGLAVAVIMDRSRTFLIEVQALYVAASSGRHFNGVQTSRADMIISVLMKQAGLKMEDSGVFLNVVSGVSLIETSGDLSVAAEICSSYLEFPIPNHVDVAFIGEIDLAGELRMVPRIEKRVINLAKLGYKTCIVPKLAENALAGLSFDGLQMVGC